MLENVAEPMDVNMKRLIFFMMSLALAIVAGAGNKPEMWADGQMAAGTAAALVPLEPLVLELPELVTSRVKKRTAVFYFSPNCPHCQKIMPTINQLVAKKQLDWVGIANKYPGQSLESAKLMVQRFKEDYKADFPMLVDPDGKFAELIGARATPNVYILQPHVQPAAKKKRKKKIASTA